MYLHLVIRKTVFQILILFFVTALSLPAQADDAALAGRYIRAYPDFFAAYRDGYLITKNGAKILFNDQRPKDLDRMVTDKGVGDDAFDPQDAFWQGYQSGTDLPAEGKPPAGDPGRIRPAAIFKRMYGSTKTDRAGRMRGVPWFDEKDGRPETVRVTTINGVDKALERVFADIAALNTDERKRLEGIMFHADGPYGYCDRPVRDFPLRTSGHAYGIAVDINGDIRYFIGGHKGEPYRYRNNVPKFLVDIFERNGFIWGGRWHSYDAMHFEYRPEFIMK